MLVDEEEGSTDNICRARAALGRSSSESLVSPLLRCVAWGDELGKGVVAGLVDVGLELEAGEATASVWRTSSAEEWSKSLAPMELLLQSRMMAPW